MKISGFSFARNIGSLYYPLKESILSILPICDEFVIAIGKGDSDDTTRLIVENIGDPKIKIIDTDWAQSTYEKGAILSKQTNIALDACIGDWCFYLQADEVVHEKYLEAVRNRCVELNDDTRIDGLLFDYKHFWGDYDHYHRSHAWYPKEIRVVRNHRSITSWGDAQSFRKNGEKIEVASVQAEVYHYGWVRPPLYMQKKKQTLDTFWGTPVPVEEKPFNYGPLKYLEKFRDSPPAVMKEWIGNFSWALELDYTGTIRSGFKHDRFKYRLLSWIEKHLFGGNQVGGFKNYRLIKR